jgi:hypothetical protein
MQRRSLTIRHENSEIICCGTIGWVQQVRGMGKERKKQGVVENEDENAKIPISSSSHG